MQIALHDDCIAISCHPSMKDLCKSIPGAKWLSIRSEWVYPRTPITAHNILQVFGDGVKDVLTPLLVQLVSPRFIDEKDLQINKKLWQHQMDGVKLASSREGLMLYYEMSCGKSLTAIAIMNYMQANKILIACPLKVVGVWPKQFRIHSERQYNILRLDDGSSEYKAKELIKVKHKKPLVVIINYDSMWREHIGSELLAIDWDLAVFDESHRIKAYTGKRVASKFCSKVSLRSKKRLALTGTPMPHSPLDLFYQFSAIDFSVYGPSFSKFKYKYAVQGGFQGRQTVAFQNQDDMSARMDFVTVYATKKNTLDLPEEIDIDIDITLDKKMRSLYNALEREMTVWVEEAGQDVTAINAMVKLLRLQQLTSGFVRDAEGNDKQIDTAKIDWLREMVQDAGQKVVVFCKFSQDLKMVRQMAEELKMNYGEVSGQCNDLTEDATIKDETEILGVQIHAGGEGVDFSKACIAVDYSVGYSLGDWLQARSRLHREGQVNHVSFYHLKATKTVDEKLFEAFAKKLDAVQVIIDGLKAENAPA